MLFFQVNAQDTSRVTKQNTNKEMNYKKLTEFEKYVIIDKGTERPFTGEYYDTKEEGTYVCRQCGAELYRSSDKFDSHCGRNNFV